MNDRTEHAFNDRRRTFLRTLGLAAGTAVLNPAGMLLGKSRTGTGEMHPSITRMPGIGVIVPPALSGQYGGEHFMSGFACRLDEVFGKTGITPALVVESCEKSPYAAMKQAVAMIGSGAIDILVAPLNADMAAQLHPVLEAHQAMFINVDVGANILRESEKSPYIFNHTLSHWQSSCELGRQAVERHGKKVMIASSLVESGYDALYAFRVGVEDAGGTLAATHVTHGLPSAEAVKAVIAEIRQAAPDVVCAMYSGSEADAFMKAYSHSGLLKRIPLVASAFAIDAHVPGSFGTSIDGVFGCRAWSHELGTEASNTFIERYERFAHHRADAFSVLGYDTAGLIVGAVRAAGGAHTDVSALRAAMAGIRIESPRGTIAMDAVTRTIEAPVYLCETGRNGVQVVIGMIAPAQAMPPTLAALQAEGRSGFSHTYLTV